MKKTKSLSKQLADGVITPPNFPIPGNKIFEKAGAALGASRGYSLRNKEFGQIIGRPESTTSYWFSVYPQPNLVSFFCLLENLLPHERHRFVDDLCRELPLIDSQKLQHDVDSVSQMKRLILQDRGITFITGGSMQQRSWLQHAFGHSFCRTNQTHRTAAGLDVHEPLFVVPIETVVYLKSPLAQTQTRDAIREMWPKIRQTKQGMVLLHGVWSAASELRDEILQLACRQHVVVVEESVQRSRLVVPDEARPAHFITVSTPAGNPSAIGVQIQAD